MSDQGRPSVEPGRDRVERLRELPLWGGFSEELLRVVAPAMEELAFAPGDAIIRRGEAGRHFSVLLAGRAEVRVPAAGGTVTTVATMGAGDSFGEMSLLSDEPTSADVVAVEGCATLALGRDAFHRLIATEPALLREFVRLLSRRVKASDAALGAARQKERDLTRFLQEQRSDQDAVLVGATRPIRELQRQVEAKGALATPLLIRGERGAGKGLVARLVHRAGPRRDAPLVACDCAQIAETQWGDQLFGLYDQGAAAHARALSYLALADGGHLLLENVQALPRGIQERLVAFLEGGPLPAGLRPDVRVIATCRGDLLEETVAGRFSPELADRLLGDVLEVPPLRERKRDIPELAAHFVQRYAQRQGKRVDGFENQALNRLVAYDYLFANVQELEEAVERAVTLTDSATIAAEAVFLGPPPLDKPRGLNLLGLPAPVVGAALRLFPGAIRAVAALAFGFILVACFAPGPPLLGKVGTLLVWAVWWPTLVVSFFVAGRAWCAVCPMAAAGEAAQRLARRRLTVERRVPAWLKEHDLQLVMAGFFLVVWAEEATGMRRSPLATGLLLLAIIAGAVTTSLLLPRRSWCRHLCPMGGLAGLCSTSSLVELRPTPDICTAKCKGHNCFKGDAGRPGCPMFHHLMFVDSNRDCVLCLDCVRLCPNGSPRLNLRVPARELWSGLGAGPQVAALVVMLLGLVAGQVVLQHWESLGSPWAWTRSALEQHRFLAVTALLAVCAGFPLAALRFGTRRLGPQTDPAALTLRWRRVTSWAPLLGSAYAAYQLGNVPGLGRLRLTLGGIALPVLPDPLLSFRLLPVGQVAVLASGLVLTAVTLWQVRPCGLAESGGRRLRARAPGLGAAAAYAVLLLLLMVLR